MGSHRLRLPLAMSAAGAAAAVATLALRPRRGLIEPARVDATAYFSASDIDRARRFRRPQRALALVDLLGTAALLATLALRPPAPSRLTLTIAARRPVAGSAATAAALSLVVGAAGLPLAIVSERRARTFGLSTQSWRLWIADLAKASAIGATLSGAGGAGLALLARRAPGRWWAPAAAAGTAASAALTFLAPVALEPLFNRFTPLDGPLRERVLSLARAAGVEVGDVYRVDASRRTTALNAYVTGLGRTKRVVLFDTLLDTMTPDEVASVVAHELAHVRHRDLIRSIGWLALLAPAAALALERLAEALVEASGVRDRQGPGLVPATALAAMVVGAPLGVAAAALSRRVEARADAFALELTRDPAALVAVERRLATRNLAEPEPPRILHRLLATHPTTLERIGYAVAWEARES